MIRKEHKHLSKCGFYVPVYKKYEYKKHRKK